MKRITILTLSLVATLAGPSTLLVPAPELAFSKATGGEDEASTLLRGADHRDFCDRAFSIWPHSRIDAHPRRS